MKITWLGQGGFLVMTGNETICVDPYISNIVEQKEGLTRIARWIPGLADIKADYYFCTHAHMDHFDPVAIPQVFEKYADSMVSGPASVVEKCNEHNLDIQRVIPAQESYCLGKCKVKTTPAKHSDKHSVGVIFESEGKRVYISGDTEFYDELASEVTAIVGGEIDAAFICINGRLGNMDYLQAAGVIKELKPQKAFPMHYGMFAENTIDPQLFVEEFSVVDGVEICVMTEGEEFSA